MRRFLCLLVLLLSACTSGPDLQLPEGMLELQLHEVVHETNPLWDPVERAVTDVRLLAGRRVAADHYEFDAEYEVQCLAQRQPMGADELRRIAESMRSQGRQKEWEQMEAQRLAAEQYLAGRVSGMKPGDKRWFQDTFVLVRVDQDWVPEAFVEQLRAGRAAAKR